MKGWYASSATMVKGMSQHRFFFILWHHTPHTLRPATTPLLIYALSKSKKEKRPPLPAVGRDVDDGAECLCQRPLTVASERAYGNQCVLHCLHIRNSRQYFEVGSSATYCEKCDIVLLPTKTQYDTGRSSRSTRSVCLGRSVCAGRICVALTALLFQSKEPWLAYSSSFWQG